MNRYILDTNICLAYIRGKADFLKQIENRLRLQASNNLILISVVTKAELLSLGKRNGWKSQKINQLSALLNKMIIININENDEELMHAYATIEAYSQGKLKGSPLNTSARNLGKNDLWIAATALVADAELITTDSDFDHLNGKWITIHKF